MQRKNEAKDVGLICELRSFNFLVPIVNVKPCLAVKRAGMEPVEFLWNESREKLSEMDGYIIVGGFSYEDRSRAGIIAALDPVMQEHNRAK